MKIDTNIPAGATHRAGNLFFRKSASYGHLWETACKSNGYQWELMHGHIPQLTALAAEPRRGIPGAGEDLLELYMDQARKTDRDDFADLKLKQAEAILGYALACGHLTPVEYGGRIAMLDLTRAKRAKN